MAITFVNTTTATSETTAAVVNNVPTGTLVGDLLIWRYSATNATREAVPAGWEEVITNTTTAAVLSIWGKIATASEPASYSTGAVTTGRHIGIMSAYRGCDPVNWIDVNCPAMVAGTTTITCPPITPATFGAWVLGCAHANVGAGVTDTTWTSSNLTIDGQTTTTSNPSNNATGGTGHTPWTSGAITPAWSASNATLRTLGASLALRPGLDPQAALIATPQGRTLVATVQGRTPTAATLDRTIPTEET